MKLYYSLSSLALLLSLSTHAALAASPLKSPQGISYIAGGIGVEEVAILKQQQKAFNLHLLFSKGEAGEAVTNVNVSIYDTEGLLVFRLLETLPRLNIQLPAGRYAIVASLLGEKQSNWFTLKEGETKRVILNWKDTPSNEAADEVN